MTMFYIGVGIVLVLLISVALVHVVNRIAVLATGLEELISNSQKLVDSLDKNENLEENTEKLKLTLNKVRQI